MRHKERKREREERERYREKERVVDGEKSKRELRGTKSLLFSCVAQRERLKFS